MKEKKQRKPKLTFFILTLALVLALAQLVISHFLAGSGEKIRFLEKRAAEIGQANIDLNEELSQMGSLGDISFKAAVFGFQPVNQILYLASPVPVALNQR